jgi:hypothetical protein
MPLTPTPSSPPSTAPLIDDAAIVHRVVEILGDAESAGRTLWTFFLDSRRVQSPVLLPTDDLPIEPSPKLTAALLNVLAQTLAIDGEGGSVLFTLERPGPGDPTGSDRAWARLLQDEAARMNVPVPGVFLAVGGRVTRMT